MTKALKTVNFRLIICTYALQVIGGSFKVGIPSFPVF